MKTIPGIPHDISEKLIALLSARPEVKEIVVFGSRAKGSFREGSDIDIALKGEDVTQNLVDLISAELEDLDIPWKIDLVIYDQLSNQNLKSHIDRVGKKL